MPLTVDVTTADGTHTRMSVALEPRAAQRVELPGSYAARPVALVLDPDVALLATFSPK